MVVLVTCKNEEDPTKNKGSRVLTRFSHYKSIGFFSNAQGQLTPQHVVESCQIPNFVCNIIIVLLTCKNEEDLIKNEGARVLTRLYIVFFKTLKGS